MMSRKFPDPEKVFEIYGKCGTPEAVISHMKAVAVFQEELLDALGSAGLRYDRPVLMCAALLHDICRHLPDHAAAGADFLMQEGFPDIASIVRDHHSPAAGDYSRLTPEDILFYSDKRVLGSRVVSLEQRFAASRDRCVTPEAIASHRAQLHRARMIETAINDVFVNGI